MKRRNIRKIDIIEGNLEEQKIKQKEVRRKMMKTMVLDIKKTQYTMRILMTRGSGEKPS